jgi:hypothetical protein
VSEDKEEAKSGAKPEQVELQNQKQLLFALHSSELNYDTATLCEENHEKENR